VWALVINFVVIPLLFIGYLLTIASSIPEEIKVGFCVAALSAGMPFAPLLARLAKADVSTATTLLVILTVATLVALPLGLPLAIDAVDAQLMVSVWDVAWPPLLFMLLPLVLGCGFRVWWPDLTPPLARWVVRVAILCLLFNLNFTLVAYWNLFVQTWGTESYIAALAGPFIGLACGYLVVSSLRVKDVGLRHATEVTTAVRNISPMLLMMIFPFGADPLVTVSITILNTIGIVTVLLFVLMWRRAASPSDTHATTNQPATEGLPRQRLRHE
jgi:BASS family bile acid:Na+ symporter